jgi:hypothetical protein
MPMTQTKKARDHHDLASGARTASMPQRDLNRKRLPPTLGTRRAESARNKWHVVVPPTDTLEEALHPGYLYHLKRTYISIDKDGEPFPDSRFTEVILIGDGGKSGCRFYVTLLIVGMDEDATELRHHVLEKHVFEPD